MKRLFCILFLFCLYYTYCTRPLPAESKLLRKRQHSCFITVIVETDKQYATHPMPVAETVGDCYINYVYLVSHYLTYNDEDLRQDEGIRGYYIVRSNYEDKGYLPFILSLLHTSTYTLIIKDEYFENEYPDSTWMYQAIKELGKRRNIDVATCHLEVIQDNDVQVSIPKGCLFFQSHFLRSIITRTEFRRNDLDPFFFFAHALRCKFQSRIVSVPFYTYHEPTQPSSWFSFLHHQPKSSLPHYSYSEFTTGCEATFNLQDIECESNRPRDYTIGVILSQYKREYIDEQIEAINHSTIPVTDIIVYQNSLNRNYHHIFKKYPSLHHIWSTNWQSPFFLRHLLPLLFKTSYHIVFDDDIIPGPDTIKILLNTINSYNTSSGVGGRIIESSNYRYGSYQMICVDCLPQEETVPVDYVIQVYARMDIQTKVFWRYRPYTHRNGDDMHSSLTWFMECKRRPRRPIFVGTAQYKNYGTDNVASYMTSTHNIVRPQTYRSWIMGGYHGIMDSTVRHDYPRTINNWEWRHLSGVMRYFNYMCLLINNEVN